MSKARSILGLLILLGAATVAVAQSTPPDINIVPRPVSLKLLAGRFVLNPETRIVAVDEESRRIAGLFNDYLLEQHGLHLKTSATRAGGRNYISFSQSGSRALPEEGYRLRIEPQSIRVTGRPAGLFYGMQTLTQLLPLELKPTIELPSLEIADQPRFGYRGLLLDVGRHFYTVEFVKKLLDLAAQNKINRFHWHLTDDQGWRIEIKRYPKLTQGKSLNPDDPAYVAYYTQEQIKDVVAYARARFITIVPEIEMPGHSGAALAAYPELGCAPVESAVAFCPKDQTFAFLEDVLSEVVEMFPSPYIHIGGDEVEKEGWRQSPEAQAILQREGLKDEDELQSYFIRRIERFLTSKNRRMIGWDEILQGGLAPNAIVMSWRGEGGGIEAVRMNHSAIMSPTDYCYFDYSQGDRKREPVNIGGYIPLAKAYGYEPVPMGLSADEAKPHSGRAGESLDRVHRGSRLRRVHVVSALAGILRIGVVAGIRQGLRGFHAAAALSAGAARQAGRALPDPGAPGSRGFLHDDGGSRRRRTALAGRGEQHPLHARRERSDRCLSTL